MCVAACVVPIRTRHFFYISLPSSHTSTLILLSLPFSPSLSHPPSLSSTVCLFSLLPVLLPSQHRSSPLLCSLFFFLSLPLSPSYFPLLSLCSLLPLSSLLSPLSSTAPAPWQHTHLYHAGCSPDPPSPFLYSDPFIPLANQASQSARCRHHTCPKPAAEMQLVGQDSFETVCSPA